MYFVYHSPPTFSVTEFVLSNYFWGAVTSKDGIAAQGNMMREEPGLENGVGGPSKGLEILG